MIIAWIIISSLLGLFWFGVAVFTLFLITADEDRATNPKTNEEDLVYSLKLWAGGVFLGAIIVVFWWAILIAALPAVFVIGAWQVLKWPVTKPWKPIDKTKAVR